MLIHPKLFPTMMIVMSAAAAIVHGIDNPNDWRKVVYWAAAAVLNFAVTW